MNKINKMASSFFSVLLVILCIINLSHADDLITRVCSRTLNPPVCFKVLKSDPRSAKADLKGLGHISIKIAKTLLPKPINMSWLSKQAEGGPKQKYQYDDCVKLYDFAVDDFDKASKALSSSDNSSFSSYASAALGSSVTCEDSFEGPPSAPKKLQKANKEFEGLTDIVLAVGALLDGQ